MDIVLEHPKQPTSSEKKNYYTGYADSINNLDPRFNDVYYDKGFEEGKKDLKASKEKQEKDKSET